MGERKIVLMSIAPGSEDAVAEALVGALGIPREFAERIVESAPVALLKGLPPEGEAAAMEAMAPVRRAGAEIVATDEAPPDAAELRWASPPRLGGHPPTGPSPLRAPPSFRPGGPSLN
jgi:hypothetical protein